MTISPFITRPALGGVQKLFHFPNGYGASVVRHTGSYGHEVGLWELAVVEWVGEDFSLCYSTPITDDVLGRLTWDEVQEALEQIRVLPARAVGTTEGQG